MPRTIWNFGWNPATWIGFGAALVTLVFAVLFIRSLYRLFGIKPYEVDQRGGTRKRAIRNAIIAGFSLIVCIIFFYFGFGPGQPVKVAPVGEEGMMKMVEEMPEEKPLEEIRKEAYEKKPEELKAQDRGFEKEAEEADAYLDKAIKKAEEAEKAGKAEKAEKGD